MAKNLKAELSAPTRNLKAELSAPTRNLKAELSAPTRKIFIVEDHPAFREGLAQILRGEADLMVCGEAGDAEEALPAIERLKPDLVLVDISLPGKSGLELIRELRSDDRKVKVLVISMHDEALYADRVLRAGGDGYIMKQEDTQEIVHAIRDVLAGHIYVSEEVLTSRGKGSQPQPPRAADRPMAQLTDVELHILELLGVGKSEPEIAQQLSLSVKAVGKHCAQIQKKLNLKTINALIRYAVCWVEGGPDGAGA